MIGMESAVSGVGGKSRKFASVAGKIKAVDVNPFLSASPTRLPLEIRLDNNRCNGLFVFSMKKALESGRRAVCPEEAVFLELLRTTDMLSRGLIIVLKTGDLSNNQYNVLRILRGSREALPCGEIASRMITRDPDITRLLDRLEKRGLISRRRETKDRRRVMAQITLEGLKLLARFDEPVQAVHRKQLGHLTRKRLRALTELLEVSRSQIA